MKLICEVEDKAEQSGINEWHIIWADRLFINLQYSVNTVSLIWFAWSLNAYEGKSKSQRNCLKVRNAEVEI